MVPSKFASPTFALTAAILGGIALAVSTCQGAVIRLEPHAATTLTSEFDNAQRSWIVNGIHPELFQDTSHERTITRFEFALPHFEPTDLIAAILTLHLAASLGASPIPRPSRHQLFAFPGTRAVEIGDFWDRQVRSDRTRVFFSIAPPSSSEITIDVAEFLRSRQFPQAETTTLSLDYSMDVRAAARILISNPRLTITTIPEPGLPVLGTLALFLFTARRRLPSRIPDKPLSLSGHRR